MRNLVGTQELRALQGQFNTRPNVSDLLAGVGVQVPGGEGGQRRPGQGQRLQTGPGGQQQGGLRVHAHGHALAGHDFRCPQGRARGQVHLRGGRWVWRRSKLSTRRRRRTGSSTSSRRADRRRGSSSNRSRRQHCDGLMTIRCRTAGRRLVVLLREQARRPLRIVLPGPGPGRRRQRQRQQAQAARGAGEREDEADPGLFHRSCAASRPPPARLAGWLAGSALVTVLVPALTACSRGGTGGEQGRRRGAGPVRPHDGRRCVTD